MQAGCVQFFSLRRSDAATMAAVDPEMRSGLFPPPSCVTSLSHA